MVDKAAIEAWVDEHYMETAVLQLNNASLKEAVLLHPLDDEWKEEAFANPETGLAIYLTKQFQNKFFSHVLPTKIPTLDRINANIHEREEGRIELTFALEVYKDDAPKVKTLLQDITKTMPYAHVSDRSETGDTHQSLQESVIIEGETMDEIVARTNELLKGFHAHTGTRLPLDMILLNPNDFKAQGQAR